MRVLIACERFGVVRRKFRALGHDAWSCDTSKAIDGSEHHIQGDALEVAHAGGWDLMIAHPPCTYLANSGASRLYKDGEIDKARWDKMRAAAAFFMALWHAPVPRIAIENPIMHKWPKELYDVPNPTQVIHPYQFGHSEKKATCLWLRRLPELRPTKVVDKGESFIMKLSPSEYRQMLRSRTYDGIAEAMSLQWGGKLK